MLSAIFCVLFGVSLLPGRKHLCLRFAEKISGGIMPDGAEEYCRRLTWVWFFILLFTATLSFVDWRLSLVSPFVVAATFFVEGRIRRRRFSVAFHTSGSTGGPKTIVKTFEALAREVDFHRKFYERLWRTASPNHKTRFLATVEPGHMYGTLWRVMLPKAMGCDVDPEVILSPESLVAKMKESERVFLVTTPSFLERFTAYASQYEVPRNCVEITTSGALLAAGLARRTREVFGVTPREIFGSTETGGVAWRRQENGDELWRVFDAVKISASPDGRLVVRSPYSFRRKYTMGDAVEISPDARAFKLLGRIDRLVKINEERVNLAEMEERVRALGFRDCALSVLDGGRGQHLAVLLVAGGDKTANRSPLELRSMMLPVFPKGTTPKRFRYVQELPRNAQGKVVAAEVRARLESALVEPEVLSAEKTTDSFSALVRFREDAPYFRGHFPGAPILPGVAQLGLAAQWAAMIVGDATRKVKTVKKMKFTHIVRPGDEVRVALKKRGESEISYEYRKGEESCSSGLLVF